MPADCPYFLKVEYFGADAEVADGDADKRYEEGDHQFDQEVDEEVRHLWFEAEVGERGAGPELK